MNRFAPLLLFMAGTLRAAVVINEVAWGGTAAGSTHQWIELFNDSEVEVRLDGWRLKTGGGDVNVPLAGAVPARGFYLLERTADRTVSDVPADKIYTGNLLHAGEDLFLLDASSASVDELLFARSGWPAGSGSPAYKSMERVNPAADGSAPSSWRSNDGAARNGLDAAGNPLNGTPKAANGDFTTPWPPPPAPPPPLSAAAPRELVINEIAWGGTAASPSHEWMELFNDSTRTIALDGWRLESRDGGLNAALSGAVPAGGYYLMERTSESPVSDIPADDIYSGSLSNEGLDLFLLDAASHTVDSARFSGSGWPAGSGSPDYRTMERVTPSADGDLPADWRSNDGSARDGLDAKGVALNGTPRARNSVFNPILPDGTDGGTGGFPGIPGGKHLVVDAATNPFSPFDRDPSRRAARFLFDAGSAQAARRILITDVRGDTVRSFSDGGGAAAAGELLWDGRDGSGRLLPPGIYIVYMESADPSGSRTTGRAAVVLGYPR